jgi:hypothetical protein
MTLRTRALLFGPILAVWVFQNAIAIGAPTTKQMQYLSHWNGETDPWADIKATVTPPDNSAHLPGSIHIRLDTVYVLGTRKDLFCHIQDYFVFSIVTNVDNAGWNTLETKPGTTTGCPNGSRPSHVVEFDIPVAASDGQHSLVFHLYSDGRPGFCPRPDSNRKASLRVSGVVSWTASSGILQNSNVTIDDLAQPHGLDQCPDANSEIDRFPDRVVDRPANLPSVGQVPVYADSSKGTRRDTGGTCCSGCEAQARQARCCPCSPCERCRHRLGRCR